MNASPIQPFHDRQEVVCPGFSRTVQIYNCHPSVIMSRDYFHSQKCLAS